MGVRPDNRLADAPMQPVTCTRCSAQVLARKASWHQTSVQWSDEAMAACTAWSAGSAVKGFPPVCEPLRQTIAQAVQDGDLPVVDGDL